MRNGRNADCGLRIAARQRIDCGMREELRIADCGATANRLRNAGRIADCGLRVDYQITSKDEPLQH
ncbi:MAG: hypothetical protein ACPGWR_24260 [Ardenticatenaceae bacterium]